MFWFLLAACAGSDPGDPPADTPPSADSPAPGDSAPPDDSGEAAPSALRFDGEPPTNLVVIIIDTLRKDYLGRYTPTEATPHFDRLLSEGLALDRHLTSSNWTAPTVLASLSGTNTQDLGYHPDGLSAPPDHVRFVAEILKDAGFSTGAVTASAGVNLLDGYQDITRLGYTAADTVVDGALEMVPSLQASGKPWLLHLHFIDPHTPYDLPEAYLEGLEDLPEVSWGFETDRDINEAASAWPDMSSEDQTAFLQHIDLRYRGEVRYLDDQLARLWDELDAMGAWEDTLVVLWSDHGESFFEHGEFAHGKTLYAQETDGVAFFWSPRIVPAGWTDWTGHADLMPTALDALGVAQSAMSGQVIGAEEPAHRFTYAYGGGAKMQLAIARGDWKLLYNWAGDKALYDVAADPGEANDLYDPTDPEVASLWELLLPEVQKVEALFPGEAAEDPGP